MTWYNINLNYQDIALFLKIAESKIDFGYKKQGKTELQNNSTAYPQNLVQMNQSMN